MAISIVSSGTDSNGTTAAAPALPATIAADDLLVKAIGNKPYSSTVGGVTGWVNRVTQTNGTTANGVDTGSTRSTIFTRVATGSDTAGSHSVTSGSPSMGKITGFRADLGFDTSSYLVASGGDSTNGANLSVTLSGFSNGDLRTGDVVVVATMIQTDAGAASAHTLTIPGCTVAQLTGSPMRSNGTTTGNDGAQQFAAFEITSGSNTGNPVYTHTNASSTWGTAVALRLRENSLDATVNASTVAAVADVPAPTVDDGQKRFYMVVGVAGSPATSDTDLRDLLLSDGWVFNGFIDDAVHGSHPPGTALLVISTSCGGSTDPGSEYTNYAGPILSFESNANDDMNWCTASQTTNATDINVVDAAHPIAVAAGLSAGANTVQSSQILFTNSGQGAGVQNVAERPGASTNKAIYCYETGAALTTGNAVNRRVGVAFWTETVISHINSLGLAVIKAAANWAANVTVVQDATVNASTVAAVASVPAPDVFIPATVSPSTVSAVASIPSPTVSGGATVNPGAVNAVASVPGPTVSISAEVNPTTVAAIASVPPATANVPAEVSPTTVAAVASVPAPSVSAEVNATVSPDSVVAVADVPSVAVIAGGDVTINAVSVDAIANIPSPDVSQGQTVSPTTVEAISSVPAPVVSSVQDANVNPTTVAAIAAVPSPTVVIGTSASVNPQTVETFANVYTPSIFAQKGATVEPGAVEAVVNIPEVGITADFVKIWDEVLKYPLGTEWERVGVE